MQDLSFYHKFATATSLLVSAFKETVYHNVCHYPCLNCSSLGHISLQEKMERNCKAIMSGLFLPPACKYRYWGTDIDTCLCRHAGATNNMKAFVSI